MVTEAAPVIPPRHRQMLLSILDLGRVTVNDIMIPRQEIAAIDLSADWEDILDRCARRRTRGCRSTKASSTTSSACCT